ncbi:MAG: nucleoside deaminase [Bacilli bacterium]|nr:nucleoside deaminase [Bacilli bacterium]
MDLKYMDMAIEEAKKAFEEDEVPVGCVIVKNNQILALTHNRKEQMNSATKHAEILAIEEASSKLNNWRLDGCDVYITLEPCPMCASALKQARVSHIFCGLSNSDFRNYEIVLKILESDKNNASVPIINDLAVEKVDKIMKDFFRNRRNS